MPISKRKSNGKQNGFKKGTQSRWKDHLPEITPPPAQVENEENGKAETAENVRQLRSASQRAEENEPAASEPAPTGPYTMIFDSASLNSSLSQFACPDCGETGTLRHQSTSLHGVITHGCYVCEICKFSSFSFQSADSTINTRVILGLKTLGITRTQLSKFFLLLNVFISFIPKTGNKSKRVVQVVNFYGTLFRKILSKVNKGLVKGLCPIVEQEALDEVENSPGPALFGIDGMYPNCVRNQTSQACLSTLIARLPNCWKIFGHFITKRAQESKPNSEFKGKVVWGKNSRSLEAMNAAELIDSHILPLSKKKPIEVSMDQDCRIKNMIDEKVKGNFEVKTTVDQAHITKNIRGHINQIVKKNGFMGDSVGRIGNRNLMRLIKICHKKIKRLCRRRKEEKISLAEIKQELKVLPMHCSGFHKNCAESGKFCHEKILHTYNGKYSAEKLKKLRKELFDDYLSNDAMAQNIFDSGCTSQNEFFHSLLTNRRLIVKNDQICVLSDFFDSNVAAGIILYNCGESNGLSRIFSHFEIELDCHIISRLESNEKKAVIRREHNLKNGPKIHSDRITYQAQFTSSSKSRLEYEDKHQYRNIVEHAHSITNIDDKNVTKRKPRKK